MLRKYLAGWPPQFLLLLFGCLFSATGSTLVWPFLSIFLREKLGVTLTAVTLLLTVYSAAGVLASFAAGAACDRYGRRLVLLVGLFCSAAYNVLMTRADSYLAFAVLIGAFGAFSTLYAIGANAMVADLVEEERRTEAYAALRMMQNVGVAIGPVIGGYLIGISYNVTFLVAACAYAVFGVLTLAAIRETLPAAQKTASRQNGGGFGPVLRDRLFLISSTSYTFIMMVTACMFLLLPVYAKENFGMPESQYGYIVTLNALMCIFLQVGVTRLTKKFNLTTVLVSGALFYAVGAGSVALGSGFWHFAASMVILTTGELILSPTSTALVARFAPAEMRGRYMSVFSLTWPVGSGAGPVIASLLNDRISPASMWYGAFCFGLLSALGYLVLQRQTRAAQSVEPSIEIPM